MYLNHFGLNEYPFALTNDTQFYVNNDVHRAALVSTVEALKMGEGFVKITGEVGSGKTMLCRKLVEQLPEEFWPIAVATPNMSPQQLVRLLAAELRVSIPEGQIMNGLFQTIATRLVNLHRVGRHVVLLIDEAQLLKPDTLEALRLIANIELPKRKLIQVVLVGQPELDLKLMRPEHRQLSQRIAFYATLDNLPRSGAGIRRYVTTRLQTAGHPDGDVFTPLALRHIARASSGVPRVVNILANKALIGAALEQCGKVGRRHAVLASEDSRSVIASANIRLELPVG